MTSPPAAPEPTPSAPDRLAALRGLAEWIESVLTAALDILLTLLLWIALVPLKWNSVRLRRYDNLYRGPDSKVEPAQAEFLFKLQREDSNATDDKVRQLLTLTTSLAAITLLFGSRVNPLALFVVLVSLLLAAVLLCLSIFEVRPGMFPTPEDSTNKETTSEWASDLMRSYYANRATHAFRVDRYRAALRYFRAALLLTPVIAVLSVGRDTQQRQTSIVTKTTTLPQVDSAALHRPGADSLRRSPASAVIR